MSGRTPEEAISFLDDDDNADLAAYARDEVDVHVYGNSLIEFWANSALTEW
jgi:hypothetical protein